MAYQDWKQVGRFKVVGVLDVGSDKTVCLIAALNQNAAEAATDTPALRIVGVAQHRSEGVTSGIVTDLDRAERVTRATVAEAEKMAGVTLDEIVVSVSGTTLSSQNYRAKVDIPTGVVTHEDVARLHRAGKAYAKRDARSLVHLAHQDFRIDGAERVVDPRGMSAQHMSAEWHAVSADEAALNNLLFMVERCYLRASHVYAAAFANGLAATSEEERRLGITCIDFGGGSTTLSVFHDGDFIFQDAIAMGANNITFDIARTLQTPLAEAERIKALYGSVIRAQSDACETFTYPLVGEDDGEVMQATKAQLSEIVRRQFDTLVRRITERLEAARITPYAGDQIVMTGGGSQLVGASTYLSQALDKRVRVAGPLTLSGLPQVMTSPEFTTVVGLLHARLHAMGKKSTSRRSRTDASGKYFGRVTSWLKQGF